MSIRVDISGAVKKTQTLKAMPNAVKYQLTRFGKDTTKSLKRSAQGLKASSRYHAKTGALSRSVNFKVIASGGAFKLVLGTGLGNYPFANKMAERYAKIQDKGGITHPTVTPRMKRWAWHMFRRYKEGKFKAIALTKKKRLTVRIPASLWFTAPFEHKKAFLKTSYLNDKVILDTAKRMSGGA